MNTGKNEKTVNKKYNPYKVVFNMNRFLIYDLLRLTKLKYHWVPSYCFSTFKIIRDFVSEDKESD